MTTAVATGVRGWYWLWEWGLWVVGLALSLLQFHLITSVIPEPYMDEAFHVPQAKRFCHWDFTWDNKITTLPGLYLTSAVGGMAVNLLNLEDEVPWICSTNTLRFFNVLLNAGLYWIFLEYIRLKFPEMEARRRSFLALTFCLFPLNFFFTSMYYTDLLSTFCVFLMVLAVDKKWFGVATFSGFMSVFTRQTNIVWCFWMILWITWDQIAGELIPLIRKGLLRSKNPTPAQVLSYLIPKISMSSSAKPRHYRKHAKRSSSNSFALEVYTVWKTGITAAGPRVFPFLLIILGFLMFVYYNNGIVVGDRTAHRVSLNFPQMFYFSLMTAFMLAPRLIFEAPTIVRHVLLNKNHRIQYLILVAIALGIVHFNTVDHPYLLADNRHLTFYLWRRFYWYPEWPWSWVKYLLVPGYVGVWFWIWKVWESDMAELSLKITFTGCIALNLVPQGLLEFRYFIIPYYFTRIQMITDNPQGHLCQHPNHHHNQQQSKKKKHAIPNLGNRIQMSEWLECIWYIIINAAVVLIFIERPFEWAHQPGVTQRIMW